MVKHIDGNLITLAKQGQFDVIAHGCNCFCRMKRGIAPQMATEFDCDKFPLEGPKYVGDINKLGQIDYKNWRGLYIVNAYTQYHWELPGSNGNIPLEYDALYICLVKLNHRFKGGRIGLPWIGCGLAGGDKYRVETIVGIVMQDCDVTIVNYIGQ